METLRALVNTRTVYLSVRCMDTLRSDSFLNVHSCIPDNVLITTKVYHLRRTTVQLALKTIEKAIYYATRSTFTASDSKYTFAYNHRHSKGGAVTRSMKSLMSLYLLPHTINLQQTTLKTSNTNMENLYKWKSNHWMELQTYWLKEELLIMRNFFFCHNVFNNPQLQMC